MSRPVLSSIAIGLLAPIALAAQEAGVCTEVGTLASVIVHPGDPIEDLRLWRGTNSSDAQTPEWREIACVPDDDAQATTSAEVPEDWGVPDLLTIESLLLASDRVQELQSAEGPASADEPAVIAGSTAGQYAEPTSRQGVRAIVVDPSRPDSPLHVIVETATPTLVRVVVESPVGSIDLAWTRSPETPSWTAVDLTPGVAS